MRLRHDERVPDWILLPILAVLLCVGLSLIADWWHDRYRGD